MLHRKNTVTALSPYRHPYSRYQRWQIHSTSVRALQSRALPNSFNICTTAFKHMPGVWVYQIAKAAGLQSVKVSVDHIRSVHTHTHTHVSAHGSRCCLLTVWQWITGNFSYQIIRFSTEFWFDKFCLIQWLLVHNDISLAFPVSSHKLKITSRMKLGMSGAGSG